MNVHIVSAIIGVALAGSILYLVRRDHLHGPYALWWLVIAAAALVLGAFPGVIDWLGRVTHIYYPPVLPIVIGLSLVLLRLLKFDIDRSRQERRIRRLVQKMALLEEELARLREQGEANDDLSRRSRAAEGRERAERSA
ncbi:MAG TPA: DUF2304 domain-containing protein [Rhodanobacteraceae bacterium]|nr:DUF2304 domain-containing protein [Rhodanobacteraceae bacterium]